MSMIEEFSLVKQGWNSVYAFVPEIEDCESEQFPADQILSFLDVHDEHLISMETIATGKPREFCGVLRGAIALAFYDLEHCDDKRAALSLEGDIKPKDVFAQEDEFQIRATNDEVYFCANIALIRRAVEEMPSVDEADVEPYAEALQKALVSYAIQNKYPVLFAMNMIEEADKPVMYKADRYLWKNRDRSRDSEVDLAVRR